MSMAMPSAIVVESIRSSLPICVLDDDREHVQVATTLLERAGFPVLGAADSEEALQKVRMGACRVVLANLSNATTDGFAFLEKALQCDPGMYVILVTDQYSVDSAVAAIKRGAYDYLCKPINFERLQKALDSLAEQFCRRSEIRDLEKRLFNSLQFQGIVGRSPAMIEVFELAQKVSRHYTNVLITGPTGAGKELVRAYFTSSARCRRSASLFAIARRWSTRCSKASFSGTFAARSREPRILVPAFSSTPMAARYSWMKLGKCRWWCRRSCCA